MLIALYILIEIRNKILFSAKIKVKIKIRLLILRLIKKWNKNYQKRKIRKIEIYMMIIFWANIWTISKKYLKVHWKKKQQIMRFKKTQKLKKTMNQKMQLLELKIYQLIEFNFYKIWAYKWSKKRRMRRKIII